MKKIILVLYLAVAYSFSYSQTIQYVSENIDTNTTWTADTVKVLENIIVSSEVTLIVQSGTYVEFQGSFSLTISGRILAMGTEQDTIVFTINDTTDFHNMESNDGGWSGIKFAENSFADTSKLEYCKFEYGKCLWVQGGRNINNTYYGGAVSAYNYSSLFIKHCVFKNNMATNGGAFYDRFTDVTISYCLFEKNYAEHHGGALYTCRSTIENNIIRNNNSGWNTGALHWDGCSPAIVNNLIIENDNGISGLENFSQLRIINNTICDNDGFGVDISGVYSEVFLANNIIYTNGVQLIFRDELYDEIELHNCNIEGGIENVTGNQYITADYDNFDQLPGFENNTGLPYQLNSNSPCINSGTEDTANLNLPEYDLLGNYRIFQSRIDVGAYEFQGLDAIYDFSKTISLNIYPNPTKGIIMLEAQGIENVELINIQGKSVYTSKSNVRNIDMEYFAKGVYFVKVITKDGIIVRKIIKE